MNDAVLVGTQIRYEQKSYWRNPGAAFFTFAFPLVFFFILVSLPAARPTSRTSARREAVAVLHAEHPGLRHHERLPARRRHDPGAPARGRHSQALCAAPRLRRGRSSAG